MMATPLMDRSDSSATTASRRVSVSCPLKLILRMGSVCVRRTVFPVNFS